MNKYEVFIWKKFLDKYSDLYTDYTYDVHLPVNIKIPDNIENQYKENAEKLTARRIDVVLRENGILWIVEIRPNATQSAIGSLLLYRYLYIAKFNPTLKVRLMLVTDYVNAEVKMLCRTVGIKYEVL